MYKHSVNTHICHVQSVDVFKWVLIAAMSATVKYTKYFKLGKCFI